MEHARDYDYKLQVLKKSLQTFEDSLGINDADFSDIEQDTIKSGKVQKFEVCTELFWKTVKKFLKEIHGIEAVSPKMVMKQLYRTQYTDEATYELLLEMVNDRNRLSHIYNETTFNEIYGRMTTYLKLMTEVVDAIQH